MLTTQQIAIIDKQTSEHAALSITGNLPGKTRQDSHQAQREYIAAKRDRRSEARLMTRAAVTARFLEVWRER